MQKAAKCCERNCMQATSAARLMPRKLPANVSTSAFDWIHEANSSSFEILNNLFSDAPKNLGIVENSYILSDTSNLTETQKHVLDIYRHHRRKNLHKMKGIPVFKNDSK